MFHRIRGSRAALAARRVRLPITVGGSLVELSDADRGTLGSPVGRTKGCALPLSNLNLAASGVDSGSGNAFSMLPSTLMLVGHVGRWPSMLTADPNHLDMALRWPGTLRQTQTRLSHVARNWWPCPVADVELRVPPDPLARFQNSRLAHAPVKGWPNATPNLSSAGRTAGAHQPAHRPRCRNPAAPIQVACVISRAWPQVLAGAVASTTRVGHAEKQHRRSRIQRAATKQRRPAQPDSGRQGRPLSGHGPPSPARTRQSKVSRLKSPKNLVRNGYGDAITCLGTWQICLSEYNCGFSW